MIADVIAADVAINSLHSFESQQLNIIPIVVGFFDCKNFRQSLKNIIHHIVRVPLTQPFNRPRIVLMKFFRQPINSRRVNYFVERMEIFIVDDYLLMDRLKFVESNERVRRAEVFIRIVICDRHSAFDISVWKKFSAVGFVFYNLPMFIQ